MLWRGDEMSFPQKVADEVLVRCGRHCCLCGRYAGGKIELHHIKQVADGGEDTADNCIPLCLDCHAEVKAYDPRHPKGRKFSEAELKGHRDRCYAKYGVSVEINVAPEEAEESVAKWFSKYENPQRLQITWGFSDVDKACPLFPGTIALVAGYTSAGKSIYVQQAMLKNMARRNKVLYFHLKDSADAIINSIIAIESLTNLENIQSQLLTEKDWSRISNALNSINFDCLKLVPFNLNSSVKEEIIVALEKSNAELIVIDDINALNLQDNNSVEEFFYKLKRLASQTNTTVLIITNVTQNHNRIDQRPMIQDIQYEALYRMCDIVQFIYRGEYDYYDSQAENRIEVINIKKPGQIMLEPRSLK